MSSSILYNELIYLNMIKLIIGLIISLAILKRTRKLKYLNAGRTFILSSGLLIIINESINILYNNKIIYELITALTYLLFAIGMIIFYKKAVIMKYFSALKKPKMPPEIIE